jgi:hypothetical protein
MNLRNNVSVDRGSMHRTTKIKMVQYSHETSDGEGEYKCIVIKIIEEDDGIATEHKFNVFSHDNSDIEVDLQGQFQLSLSNKED